MVKWETGGLEWDRYLESCPLLLSVLMACSFPQQIFLVSPTFWTLLHFWLHFHSFKYYTFRGFLFLVFGVFGTRNLSGIYQGALLTPQLLHCVTAAGVAVSYCLTPMDCACCSSECFGGWAQGNEFWGTGTNTSALAGLSQVEVPALSSPG